MTSPSSRSVGQQATAASGCDILAAPKEATLSQVLNRYRHEGYADWVAEYRIKVVPDAEYWGTWYIASTVVGDYHHLPRDEAPPIVHAWGHQAAPDTPSLDSGQIASHPKAYPMGAGRSIAVAFTIRKRSHLASTINFESSLRLPSHRQTANDSRVAGLGSSPKCHS